MRDRLPFTDVISSRSLAFVIILLLVTTLAFFILGSPLDLVFSVAFFEDVALFTGAFLRGFYCLPRLVTRTIERPARHGDIPIEVRPW